MRILFLTCIFLSASAKCFGDYGGLAISGGKPVVIVFPTNCEELDWKENNFGLRILIFREVDTGSVSNVLLMTDEGKAVNANGSEIQDVLPKWKALFLKSILEAVKQWKFQKTKSDKPNVETGVSLGNTVGSDYTFRLSRFSKNVCRIQIFDINGRLIANDSPKTE